MVGEVAAFVMAVEALDESPSVVAVAAAVAVAIWVAWIVALLSCTRCSIVLIISFLLSCLRLAPHMGYSTILGGELLL